MGSKKNEIAKHDGVKIADLGTELNVDPRQIVAAAKEMAMENAKVPASWVTDGQADRLRAKFGGHKELKEKIKRMHEFHESGGLPAEEAPAEKALQSQDVKLGKKTFEKDRRSIFGVVETPGGVRLYQPAPAADSSAKARTTDASATPPVEISDAKAPEPQNLAMPLPPPKKFLGVQVAPPVRREPGQSDTRFGVVSPAPAPTAPAAGAGGTPAVTGSGMWDKLNDGRPALDLSATGSSGSNESIKSHDVPYASPDEPKAPAPSEAAPEAQLAAAAPIAAETEAVAAKQPESVPEQMHADEPPSSVRARHELLPPKMENVPVRRAPSHKAFGAKTKGKHKKIQLIEKHKASSGSHKAAHSAAKSEERVHEPVREHAEPKRHSVRHAKPHGEPSEGLLKRIVKKIFRK